MQQSHDLTWRRLTRHSATNTYWSLELASYLWSQSRLAFVWEGSGGQSWEYLYYTEDTGSTYVQETPNSKIACFSSFTKATKNFSI